METSAATHGRVSPRRGPRRSTGPRGTTRLRRIFLIASLFVLIPAAFSYVGAIRQTSNSSLGIRTVEWLRDNGGAGLVAKVESIYYSLTAPSKGGPTLRALPKVGVGGTSGVKVANLSPALADELQLQNADEGVVVVDVDNGSYASNLGFRRGDIIVSVNGEHIAKTHDLARATSSPNRSWKIVIRRGGQQISAVFNG